MKKDQPISLGLIKKRFIVPVLAQSVSISSWLVPGPARCLDVGAAKRPKLKLFL
jgi:hypothetical protein